MMGVLEDGVFGTYVFIVLDECFIIFQLILGAFRYTVAATGKAGDILMHRRILDSDGLFGKVLGDASSRRLGSRHMKRCACGWMGGDGCWIILSGSCCNEM